VSYPSGGTEAGLQAVVVQALRALGYVVLITTHRVKRCPCGRWSRGDYGSTRGVPDLLVTRAGWGNHWIALELKRPGGGRLSPEQRQLVGSGSVAVVKSLEEAVAAVQASPESGDPAARGLGNLSVGAS
jgi:hypothetical protein